MSSYGKQIMQAVTLILEAEHSVEVKEQVSEPFVSHYKIYYTPFTFCLLDKHELQLSSVFVLFETHTMD